MKEIKNPKIIFSNDLTPFLKKFTLESYLIHQIEFSILNNEIKYILKNTIHNLHPRANKIKCNAAESNAELKHYIPYIIKELNLSSNQVSWYWCTNNKNTGYIFQDFEIEDLSQEQRFFLYCYHTLKKENYKIKKTNKEIIFKLNSKAKIEQYIHQKQYALENLTHRLIKEITLEHTSNLNQFSNNYDKTDCLKITYIYLEKLHHFIEKEYKIYLNLNSQIPFRSTFIKEFKISKKINEVKTIFLKSNINDKVLKLVYEPILKIETLNIHGNLTYYEFNYCSEIIKELYKQIESENLTEEVILDCLFDLNFNSLQLFKYITNTILQELEPLEDNTQKIYDLFRILKIYNQKQSRNAIKYKTNLPSIKKQIIAWIEEEINYLNKIIDQEKNQFRIPYQDENNIKFLSVFSVAQLSFFFGLLIDTNIIDHKNQADVIRFIAKNFKTKNTDKIAIESLRTKFHNVESATIKVVQEKLLEIIALTKD
ncbi:hypothetical protein [Flavobacterium cellulosilyticum]|uniref:hypothetical protein n=1 Tax=Flavobacterium cellulosilyticum TaxID=2541731 RepID=UPI0014044A48|nr:hypothetical protein [Flavobacterium cellulosilyticum]